MSSSLSPSLPTLSSSPSLPPSLSLPTLPSSSSSSSLPTSPYRSPTCSNKYIYAASPSNNYQGNNNSILAPPPPHHHHPIPPRPSTALSTIAPVALHLHQPIYLNTIIYLNTHKACGKLLPNNCSTTAEANTPWMVTELLPMIHHHHYHHHHHHPDTCGRRCV